MMVWGLVERQKRYYYYGMEDGIDWSGVEIICRFLKSGL
jgi:hypothetical protein